MCNKVWCTPFTNKKSMVDYDERKKHEKRKKKRTQEILFLNLEVVEYKMKMKYIEQEWLEKKIENKKKIVQA